MTGTGKIFAPSESCAAASHQGAFAMIYCDECFADMFRNAILRRDPSLWVKDEIYFARS